MDLSTVVTDHQEAVPRTHLNILLLNTQPRLYRAPLAAGSPYRAEGPKPGVRTV